MKAIKSVVLPLLLLMVLLSGCRSHKTMMSSDAAKNYPACLSSKVQLTIPNKNSSFSLNGSMKMKSGERIQLSLLMPIFRTEVVRMEVTPDEILLVDRMNKRYVRATREELKGVLPEDADFGKLEELLFKASLPEGRSELTGRELGIPSIEKAKVKLYDFSTSEFTLNPTEVSSKYTQVPLEDVVKMLLSL